MWIVSAKFVSRHALEISLGFSRVTIFYAWNREPTCCRMDEAVREELDKAIVNLQERISNDDFMNALRASLSKTYNCTLQQCEIDLGDSLCLLHDNSFISLANDDFRDPICPLPPNSSASSPGDRKTDSGYASRRERPLSSFDLRPRDSAPESPLAKSPSLPFEKRVLSGDIASPLHKNFSDPPWQNVERHGASGPCPRVPFEAFQPKDKWIDLNFLGQLSSDVPSGSVDELFPRSLYVRQSMRQIFRLFCEDADKVAPRMSRTVLLGSPGVGKSILFFLAALHRSQRNVTIYYRFVSESEEDVSVFVMLPCPGNKVHVLFTRKLKRNQLTVCRDELSGLDRNLSKYLKIQRHHYFAFVDGPRHDDYYNTLLGVYDYFCTSGGHPYFHGEEEFGSRLWVLDAWTETEAVDALTAHNRTKDTVEQAYWLCGGSIQDILGACTPAGYSTEKEKINCAVEFFLLAELAVLSSERLPASQGNHDRYRRMFRADRCVNNKEMETVQWVDSKYLMSLLLCERIGPDRLYKAYNLGQEIKENAIQGWYFALIIHQWFMSRRSGPIASVCWSQGTREECVAQLMQPKVYWIPSVNKFAIDAAVVIDDTIHALRIAIHGSHTFDFELFQTTFVDPITAKFNINSVVVYLVVPKNAVVDFENSPIKKVLSNHRVQPSVQAQRQAKKQKTLRPIRYDCRCHFVDMSTVDSMGVSMQALPFLTAAGTLDRLCNAAIVPFLAICRLFGMHGSQAEN
jgi:hypothetical protein